MGGDTHSEHHRGIGRHRRLARVGVALALAQGIAVAPSLERYRRAEHACRVAKAIRRTRPGR